MASLAGYAPLNNTVVRGSHEVYTFRFKENGVPVDASSWLFFHTIKRSYEDLDSAAVSALNPADMTFSNYAGTNDQLQFTVPNTVTDDLEAGTYYQDLKVIRSGIVRTYAKGQFVVEAWVTQRTVAP